MVIFLSVYPLLLAAGIVVVDSMTQAQLMPLLSSSFAFSALLCLAVLSAILVAAVRQRDNAVLLSAWLFLFCGVLIVSLGYLVEPFVAESASWIEEIFETVSFFPLVIFAIYVVSPLRILMLPRRQEKLFPLLGLLLLLVVICLAFVPWLFLFEGPRLHSSAENLLHLAQVVLDILLLEPIGFVVLVIGVSRGSGPYFLLGLGLLLLLPEDILGGFQVLRLWNPYGQFSHLLFLASQLYMLNGALLSAFSRRERQATPGTRSSELPGRGTSSGQD